MDRRQLRFNIGWVIACSTLFAGFVETASAENWTRFRGPNGTGIAPPGFSTAISENDFSWKIALPGVGHSSPVVWDDHVYLTSADKQAARRFVLCLSTKDGAVAWKHEESFVAYAQHRDSSYASATPAADDLGVYVAWTMPREYTLMALRHDGKERWRKNLGGFQSLNGSGSSPIVVGDLVILNDDQEANASTLYAFDRVSGAIRWKIEQPSSAKAAMSTPCVWRTAAGAEHLIVTTWEGGIEGVDIQSGKMLWQAKDVFFSRAIGSPVIGGDLVIGANGDGTGKRGLVALHPGAAGEAPAVVYKLDQVGPYVPTPIIIGERLLMLNDVGQLTCAKIATGEIVWSQKVKGNFYGSPICSGDVLWAIARTGDLIGVNVADGCKPFPPLSLGESSNATPAIADGRMYLRTVSHLICVKSHGN